MSLRSFIVCHRENILTDITHTLAIQNASINGTVETKCQK